jgi:thioredoxin-like negative regulator of GroEL
MSDNITTLSDSTFDEVVRSSDKPILVDFWAEMVWSVQDHCSDS